MYLRDRDRYSNVTVVIEFLCVRPGQLVSRDLFSSPLYERADS